MRLPILLLCCAVRFAAGFFFPPSSVSSGSGRRLLPVLRPSRSSAPAVVAGTAGIATELRGGYDATVGSDPSAPIQFFALPGKSCPYAQRTHICLLELELPFDSVEVTGMPKPDWYLKINPRGKVPALRVPSEGYDAVVYESGICDEFLCDYAASLRLGREEGTLMPADPLRRARVRLLNDHCDNVFAKTQFTYLMNGDADKDESLRREMEDALTAYEDALVESGGPYFLGEKFALAGVHVFPFLQRLTVTLKHWKGYELPEGKFARLREWIGRCEERPSARASSMTREETIAVYERFVEVDYGFGGLNENG